MTSGGQSGGTSPRYDDADGARGLAAVTTRGYHDLGGWQRVSV
jgi:hypothetical protein